MPVPDTRSLQTQLRAYLMDELTANSGSIYIKSRHIAGDVDASVKQIGAALAALERDPAVPFMMQRRGGTSDGTTWYVNRRQSIERQ